ncbi:MAG: hypothetical protein QXQ14_01835 [Candidatus Aenigmatarchaeota archaeon]
MCESCYLEFIEEEKTSYEEMVGNSYCLMCHEIMNGYSSNKKIVSEIQEFLRKKGNFEREIEKLEKIKNLPICRWDLWQLLANVLEKKDKSLANYFRKKVVNYYDFHWVIGTF